MTVDVTYVELKNFPKYVCQIDVFGVPCLLAASYNTRKGQRLISLTSYDGEIVYLKPTFITNADRVFLNFNMLLNELNVYVTLEALMVSGVKQTSTDYLNWGSSYRLAFVSLPPTERLLGFRNLNDSEAFIDNPPTTLYLDATLNVNQITGVTSASAAVTASVDDTLIGQIRADGLEVKGHTLPNSSITVEY